MPRLKPEFEICSFGLYTAWDRESKELPKIRKHTLEIHAETGVEFGLILSVKKAKGEVLEYRIDHPPFTDEQGNIAPPFEGHYYISSNDFRFFLGDTVWEPVEDKKGIWKLSYVFGKQYADYSMKFEDFVGDFNGEIKKLLSFLNIKKYSLKVTKFMILKALFF